MTFTFVNDGTEVEDIMQCQHCDHIQTRRNFGDDGRCALCQRNGFEKIETIEKQTGMSNFQYRKLLDALQQDCSGVGGGVIGNIEEVYPDGDAFVTVCRDAYDEQAYEPLTEVSGVGESTARKIALSMADLRDWEGGLAESEFSLT